MDPVPVDKGHGSVKTQPVEPLDGEEVFPAKPGGETPEKNNVNLVTLCLRVCLN